MNERQLRYTHWRDRALAAEAREERAVKEARAAVPLINRQRERAEAAEAQRDHYRDLVEKVGVASALQKLIDAADPLCGKPEVIPDRVKLPPEFYPAALPTIQVLREAVANARAALAAVEPEDGRCPCGLPLLDCTFVDCVPGRPEAES